MNHPQAVSENVCPACRKGYCPECCKTLNNAAICPQCDGLCTRTAEMEAKEQRARQRLRTMAAEVPSILRYPLTDPLAYVLLSVVVSMFAFASHFGGFYGVLFTQGLLMAYSFTALNRVSAGHMQGYMPDISDISDLRRPVRLGLAALLISSGPSLALVFVYPDVLETWALAAPPEPIAYAQSAPASPAAIADDEDEPAEEAESPTALEARRKAIAEAQARAETEARAFQAAQQRRRVLALGLFGLAALWKLVYSPIALIAAGISQSFLQTINPVLGVDAIRRMGSVYWQAAGIYTVMAVIQWGLGVACHLIPIAGIVLQAFVESYAWLAIGCTLGLAVFKKAPELGLD